MSCNCLDSLIRVLFPFSHIFYSCLWWCTCGQRWN